MAPLTLALSPGARELTELSGRIAALILPMLETGERQPLS